MPSTITGYNTFSPNTLIKSSEINDNFSNHRGDLIPINSDTATASDNAHDLGKSEHRWKNAYVGGTIDLTQQSTTPSVNPTAGAIQIYGKTGISSLYLLDENGLEKKIGSGGGSGLNLESDPYAQNGVGSWAAFADGATTGAVDLTGGTPSLTITASSTDTAILNGDYAGAFIMSIPASNIQGNGVSRSFDIPVSFRNRGFVYVSGRYYSAAGLSTGDWKLQFYDNTNTQILNYNGLVDDELGGLSAGGTGYFTAMVPIANDTATLTCGFFRPVTTASADTVKFSDLKISDQPLVDAPIVGYQGTWTPTVSNDTGAMTNYSITGHYWRRDDTLIAIGRLIFTGSPGTWTTFNITLPPGLTFDTSKHNATLAAGTVKFNDVGTTWYNGGGTRSGTNVVRYTIWAADVANTSARSVSQAVPFAFVSGDTIDFTIEVPITEWANQTAVLSTTEMMNETIKVSATHTSGQTLTSGSTITLTGWNEVDDTHNAFNASTGIFTAPKTAKYRIVFRCRADAVSMVQGQLFIPTIKLNGSSEIARSVWYAKYTVVFTDHANIIYDYELSKGDTLEFAVFIQATTPTMVTDPRDNMISIEELPDFSVYSVYPDVQKTQVKYLTADATTDTTLSDLTFSNLEVGKWYEINLQGAFARTVTTVDNIQLKAMHNSQQLGTVIASLDNNSFEVRGVTIKFQAAVSTLTFESASVAANSSVNGNGTTNETFVRLTELSNLQTTTEW